MTYEDDRTRTQMKTHTVLVVGTDRFMSGWGGAEGGASYAGWACRPEDSDKVLKWVRRRGDQMRIRITSDPYRPRNAAHVHIYVVVDGHPALR
jgi:hypothetical protein